MGSVMENGKWRKPIFVLEIEASCSILKCKYDEYTLIYMHLEAALFIIKSMQGWVSGMVVQIGCIQFAQY